MQEPLNIRLEIPGSFKTRSSVSPDGLQRFAPLLGRRRENQPNHPAIVDGVNAHIAALDGLFNGVQKLRIPGLNG